MIFMLQSIFLPLSLPFNPDSQSESDHLLQRWLSMAKFVSFRSEVTQGRAVHSLEAYSFLRTECACFPYSSRVP